MAVNGTINKTTFTDATLSANIKAKAAHITELRTAITKLNDTYAPNVVNQGNQACQNSCTCQSDKNRSCQNACTCQSSKNESCQDSCINCTNCANQGCQNSCTNQSCQNTCNNQSNQKRMY